MSDKLSPIEEGFADPPKPYPLGWPIKDKVSIREIDRRVADRIYENHHSYLPRGRCGWHYGVYLDDSIVGAISFDNWPSQSTIRGFASDEIIEVSRVCIGNDTPNLASCAMSKAQDQFVEKHPKVKLLITYIRGGYDGSMFKALRGEGLEFDGVSYGKERGPHHGDSEIHEIYTVEKQRWVCPVNRD